MEKQDLKTLLENIYALLLNESLPPGGGSPPTVTSADKFTKSYPPSLNFYTHQGGPPQGPPPLPPNAPNWPFQGVWPPGTTSINPPAGMSPPPGQPMTGPNILWLNIPGGANPWYVVMPQGPSFMWAGSSWIPFG